MKRFYRDAAACSEAGGHGILLDGKSLKSPAGKRFLLPSAALAEAIATEWRDQGEKIVPVTMPLMQLAATAIDRVTEARAETVATVAGFGATDLLCYRAESPRELVERQERLWQPLVDWARLHLDAPLVVVAGVVPRPQPREALKAIEAAVAALDAFRLTALASATGAAGSVILGLALIERRLPAIEVYELSQLDESFQIEKWGEDAEAARRRADLKAEIEAAEQFLTLLEA
ncbi:MAG: ATP12 family chaperone protein [Pseudomonadota bacterium]